MRNYKIGEKNRYEITPNRYVELRYFCMRYDELKEGLRACMDASLQSSSGAGHGTGMSGSVPERIVERREKYARNVELIEKAARLACGEDKGVVPFLMYSVTKGAAYERVPMIPPCGRRVFYEKYRRAFYYHLDRLKG